MWRDPLDELIDDLERVAPEPRSTSADLLPIERLQHFTDIILYGSSDEIETLKADPTYQQWIGQTAAALMRSRERAGVWPR